MALGGSFYGLTGVRLFYSCILSILLVCICSLLGIPSALSYFASLLRISLIYLSILEPSLGFGDCDSLFFSAES